jgi:hypothetical protein
VLQCRATDRSFNNRGRGFQDAKFDMRRPADRKSLLIEYAVLDEMEAAPPPRPYFVESVLAQSLLPEEDDHDFAE